MGVTQIPGRPGRSMTKRNGATWVAHRGLCLIGVLAALTGRLAADEPARSGTGSETGFAAVVEAHFDQWGHDQDGALSFLETSRLVPDTSIRGETAAALSAIHLVQRGERWYRAR